MMAMTRNSSLGRAAEHALVSGEECGYKYTSQNSHLSLAVKVTVGTADRVFVAASHCIFSSISQLDPPQYSVN